MTYRKEIKPGERRKILGELKASKEFSLWTYGKNGEAYVVRGSYPADHKFDVADFENIIGVVGSTAVREKSFADSSRASEANSEARRIFTELCDRVLDSE